MNLVPCGAMQGSVNYSFRTSPVKRPSQRVNSLIS